MADLNALIAQGAQFRVPPPVDPMGNMPQLMQMQSMQQQNQLNQMTMQEKQRGQQEMNALRRLDPSSATYLQDVKQINPKMGFEFEKMQREAKNADTEGQIKNVKLLADRLALLPEAYRRADTPEAYLTLHQSIHADPVVGPWLKSTGATLERGLETIRTAVDTGKFNELRAGSMQSVAQILDSMKPLIVPANASVYAGGKYTQAPAAPAAPGKSIGSVSPGDFTPASLAKFNVSGNFGDLVPKPVDRAPRPEAAVRTQQVTLEDGSLGIVNMDTGVITRSTVGGAPVKGKPSALAEKQAAAKVQLQKDLGFAITELSDAIKEGGLIDQSTGSGAGRLADLSAGFVGKATPGAIAIGKLQPIADLPLKLVTRFEGPQSNADTKSYKEASAQLADPTLPRAIRKAAGATVVRLMKERQGQFVTNDMAPTVENAAKASPTAEAAAFLKSLGVNQ